LAVNFLRPFSCAGNKIQKLAFRLFIRQKFELNQVSSQYSLDRWRADAQATKGRLVLPKSKEVRS